MQTDFYIHDQGSVVVIIPATEAAEQWTLEHIPDDAPRFGLGFVVEHRYADDVIEGAITDGLIVQAS